MGAGIFFFMNKILFFHMIKKPHVAQQKKTNFFDVLYLFVLILFFRVGSICWLKNLNLYCKEKSPFLSFLRVIVEKREDLFVLFSPFFLYLRAEKKSWYRPPAWRIMATTASFSVPISFPPSPKSSYSPTNPLGDRYFFFVTV